MCEGDRGGVFTAAHVGRVQGPSVDNNPNLFGGDWLSLDNVDLNVSGSTTSPEERERERERNSSHLRCGCQLESIGANRNGKYI